MFHIWRPSTFLTYRAKIETEIALLPATGVENKIFIDERQMERTAKLLPPIAHLTGTIVYITPVHCFAGGRERVTATVRENVCNNSKKRKKSCFFGF